jgi:hypothetical protein
MVTWAAYSDHNNDGRIINLYFVGGSKTKMNLKYITYMLDQACLYTCTEKRIKFSTDQGIVSLI